MRLAFALCLYSTQADSIHTPHPHHIYSADFFSNLDKNRLKLLSHKSPQEKTKQTRTKTKQKQIMAFRTTPINEDEHTQFLRKYSDSAKFDAVKLTHDRILIFNRREDASVLEICRQKSDKVYNGELCGKIGTDFYLNWLLDLTELLALVGKLID